jgi:MoaA/NifB/PqqE/SkfB family radical SAM enzyme
MADSPKSKVVKAEKLAKPSATNRVKRAALYKLIDYLMEDPETNIEKILNLLDTVVPKALYANQRKAFRGAIEKKNNWYRLILKTLKMNPEVMPQLLKTFVVDSNLLVWPQQEENRKNLKCNIPWAVLLDPTSACNLHCTGCWAAEYGHKEQLTYEEIDSIINQANELGTHMFIYTGGEPLVRKKDIIKLCEAHPDSAFLSFTNATLIDEDFCKEMVRVKNFVPAISVEGIGEATDVRRGDGTFERIDNAMNLLRKYQLPYGVSCCYTKQNCDAIASEEFIDWIIDKGALFAWFFTFMPVGYDTGTELMATAEQRKYMYKFIRDMRDTKELFTMDFWNDGEFVGGCIAGGRRYLHINAAGDVEPCVFAHYANANIRTSSLLDALRSPIFMEYYNNQPFDGSNLLRPCPILDNSGKLTEMVERSGAHSTDLQHEETAEHLCAKTAETAKAWKPVADSIWFDKNDPRYSYRKDNYVGQADSDIARFERLGKIGSISPEDREKRFAEESK